MQGTRINQGVWGLVGMYLLCRQVAMAGQHILAGVAQDDTVLHFIAPRAPMAQ